MRHARALAYSRTPRGGSAPAILALALLAGCVLEPLDHEGKRCPCADGSSCVDAGGVGMCVARPADAGQADAGQEAGIDGGLDGGPCPSGAPASCSDGLACVDGTQGDTVCAEGTLYQCVGGAIRTVACPRGCTSDGRTCELTPHFLEELPTTESPSAARLEAGDRPVWVLDTDRGELTRFADRTLSGEATAAADSGLAFDGLSRAFVADTLVIEPGVTVIGRGTRPLVIYALQRIEVGTLATVSVSARGIDPGPAGSLGASVGGEGAAPGSGPGGGESCQAPGSTIYKSGGGGGGFGTAGGEGARAGCCSVPSPGGAAWGSDLSRLQGGSGGGAGCVASVGGAGGGALYLLAGVEIRVDGDLESGGGGGLGGAPTAGGGGGGSGGAIVLEAPRVEIRGRVAVGGGSGGQGGFHDPSGATVPSMAAGANGTDGSAVQIPARTTDVEGAGGLGGAGSDADGMASAGGRGARQYERGGGGGGGAGRVWVYRLAGGPLVDRVLPAGVLIEGALE